MYNKKVANFHPYKPLRQPFAYEAFKLQNKMHWLAEEVSLVEDVGNFKQLTDAEKNPIINIFKFFTQSDIEVNEVYLSVHGGFEGNKYYTPELKMMFSAFANAEAVHTDAYSKLIESLGIEETIYTDFFEDENLLKLYEAIKKHQQKPKSMKDYIFSTLFFATIIEGISLFGFFIILLRYTKKFNILRGMSQIVTWSMRDESLHIESMITYACYLAINENVNVNELINYLDESVDDVYPNLLSFLKCVVKEPHFILELENHLKFLVVSYKNSIYKNFNLSTINNEFKPIDWALDYYGEENVNFFNQTPTQYSRLLSVDVDWDNL